jgi:hypothetical protein
MSDLTSRKLYGVNAEQLRICLCTELLHQSDPGPGRDFEYGLACSSNHQDILVNLTSQEYQCPAISSPAEIED